MVSYGNIEGLEVNVTWPTLEVISSPAGSAYSLSVGCGLDPTMTGTVLDRIDNRSSKSNLPFKDGAPVVVQRFSTQSILKGFGMKLFARFGQR